MFKLIRRKDNFHLYWQNREISYNISGGHSLHPNPEDAAWNSNSLGSQQTLNFPKTTSPFAEPEGFQETDNGDYEPESVEPDPTLNIIHASSPFFAYHILKICLLNIQVRIYELLSGLEASK